MKGKKTGNNVVKTNEKKEKTKLIMGIAMMVLAVAVAGGTYAYYQSTITGTVSGTILAWDCVNGTANSGALALGDLKPGTSGSFPLKGYSTNFKTEITFVIKSGGTNVPANLKFYKDSAHSNSITLGSNAWQDTVNAGTTGVSHTVYWEWARGTAGETPAATGTTNKTMSISYEITCKQSSTQ